MKASTQNPYIPATEGMLGYLVHRVRPELVDRIAEEGRVETAVLGLGRQGTRHAGLMAEFGTTVTAAVAPERGGTHVHETIPVYNTVAEMLDAHPAIAAASVWRHYSTAAEATIEAIEAGLPIIALITEGMPVKDVRRVLVTARKHKTLLLGPNTPGVIFPPERVKIGMLPDVFYPAEPRPGRYTADGVTICSRSGAILYHMSDALAAAGIAQNAVIGVGGDSAVGSPFVDIVPVAAGFRRTQLVVVAGEIGGCQEEVLAGDIEANPKRYPKPIVALVSGRCAPEGKTMGHAGAIIAPGSEYGTFASKKAALEAAGVTVVNSQRALVQAVRKLLRRKTYFLPERYYERMEKLWEAPPPEPSWGTAVTQIEPNLVAPRGVPLAELIGRRSFLEVTSLLVSGELPGPEELAWLDQLGCRAAAEPVPEVAFGRDDDVSKQLATLLLVSPHLARFSGSELEKTACCLGYVAACFSRVFGTELEGAKNFSELACRAVAGGAVERPEYARMLEATMVACVDHGVTPPSAQATILASSVRAAYEVAVASGISAITDVHGGAGARAVEFFRECVELAGKEDLSMQAATESVIHERMMAGKVIEGLGHRVHTQDPRRDALWKMAEETGLAGPCVASSRVVEDAFSTIRGMTLPINVDGVIGAIVADLGLDARVAKALFIFGRVAGLSAHHFEEVDTQQPMRRIEFSQAVFKG